MTRFLKKRNKTSVRLVEPGERVVNANYQDSDNLDICRLPIGDPADFIDEIVFDPRMPDSLVRAYTAHLITTFNYTKSCFKSKIYESPKLGIEIGGIPRHNTEYRRGLFRGHSTDFRLTLVNDKWEPYRHD